MSWTVPSRWGSNGEEAIRVAIVRSLAIQICCYPASSVLLILIFYALLLRLFLAALLRIAHLAYGRDKQAKSKIVGYLSPRISGISCIVLGRSKHILNLNRSSPLWANRNHRDWCL